MIPRLRIHLICLICTVAAVASGCDATPDGMATVTGRVTVNGQPAAAGAITFTPSDGTSQTSGGKIVDGRYEAAAPIGVMRVMIRIPKVVGERKLYDTPDSPIQPIMNESLPPRYNDQTELEIEVHPGETECSFDLSSQ